MLRSGRSPAFIVSFLAGSIKILRPVLFTLIVPAIAVSAASAETQKEITVSAAMSLRNAFEEIGKAYELKNRGTKVVFNFGASGDLVRQIEGGAPVDVFAAASQKDMDDLEKKGLVSAMSKVIFARGGIALVVPRNSKVPVKYFTDLASGNVRRISIGNPKTVPAGRYADEVLDYYKISSAVKDKLIFAENVRQVLDYVARGEVDAGIVYSTDALLRAREVAIVATAPGASHKPVVYPMAIVSGTKREAPARGFILYVMSPQGKKILEKYGFKAGLK